jgi:hypothetical protein
MTPVRTVVAFDAETGVISLVTRTLFVWRKRQHQRVDAVRAIDALNRDALTHDEVFVRFYADGGGLVVSEFDGGFHDLMVALTPLFPGIERWNDVTPAIPLTEAAQILWERSGGDEVRR